MFSSTVRKDFEFERTLLIAAEGQVRTVLPHLVLVTDWTGLLGLFHLVSKEVGE